MVERLDLLDACEGVLDVVDLLVVGREGDVQLGDLLWFGIVLLHQDVYDIREMYRWLIIGR